MKIRTLAIAYGAFWLALSSAGAQDAETEPRPAAKTRRAERGPTDELELWGLPGWRPGRRPSAGGASPTSART